MCTRRQFLVGSVFGLSAGIAILLLNAGLPGFAALAATLLVAAAIIDRRGPYSHRSLMRHSAHAGFRALHT